MNTKHVAVLGAGIMGGATALLLARRGARVMLFDKAPAPFRGASRWNEGKIHLGYLYAADSSLRTARRLLPGGIAFKRLTEELIGRHIDRVVTTGSEVYLVHRDTIVGLDAMKRHVETVTKLAAEHPDHGRYFVDPAAERYRRLSATELDGMSDTSQILAGFEVPERSVSTAWLADRFVEAIDAEPRIEQRMNVNVLQVRASGGALSFDGPLTVETDGGNEGPFDVVVNALWEGRIGIDDKMGIRTEPGFSHRFRLAAFVRTGSPIDLQSAVISLGPFGDLKSYGRHEFYLSWYPTGLQAEGTDVIPPDVPLLCAAERERIGAKILEQLAVVVPRVREVIAGRKDMKVEGGWVYAAGKGSLRDPAATIHRRDNLGIRHHGRYLSVDTGKYSIAPLAAEEVTRLICS